MLFGTYNIDKSSFEHYIFDIKPLKNCVAGYLNISVTIFVQVSVVIQIYRNSSVNGVKDLNGYSSYIHVYIKEYVYVIVFYELEL
jgi:hypothetical protein